jgi:NADPH:quinone reductase-like Zn-dependent oxidoreductase
VKGTNAFKIPALSLEESVNLGSLTSAYIILNNYSKLNSGDVVLVCNGDSGLSSAISQVANAIGVKVKAVTESEINDSKFAETAKAAGSVKLAVIGKSGKYLRQIFKVLPSGGKAVVYQGSLERNADTEGLDIPMGAAIFSNISVESFNLRTAAVSDPSGFQTAVTETAKLISNKKIALSSKSFASGDFSGAIDAAKAAGVPSVLKF